mgnify:CR=1 FL=1
MSFFDATNLESIWLLISEEVFDYLEEIKGYTKSSKGKAILVDQRDHYYLVNNFSKTSAKAWWRCNMYLKKKCPVTLISYHNKVIQIKHEHNHEPIPPHISKNRKDQKYKQNDPLFL